MEFSTDRNKISDWAPLIMRGRDDSQPVAANFSAEGTDVDFGMLTRQMVRYLQKKGVKTEFGQHVESIKRQNDGTWEIKTSHMNKQEGLVLRTRFLFLGAGGGALTLLQKSGIPEGKGYGGFPVSGLFFRNSNPETVAQHNAKVYGQASVGAPPMSVPPDRLRSVQIPLFRSSVAGPVAKQPPTPAPARCRRRVQPRSPYSCAGATWMSTNMSTTCSSLDCSKKVVCARSRSGSRGYR